MSVEERAKVKQLVEEAHNRGIRVIPYFGYELSTLAPEFYDYIEIQPLDQYQILVDTERVETMDDIDAFTEKLWTNLNEDNKVSLFVRYIDIESGEAETRIVNKNK